ncbi:MAG: hypothetical protein FJ010_05255 [Chloroflexi bacterium]|nr:hypothetical protein [Chloroflexota bacterium]
MKPTVILKSAIIIAILVAGGAFFGVTCNQVSHQYAALFSPDSQLLGLALRVFGAILSVAFGAGLLVALVRPFWVAMLGFGLSALATILLWGINWITVIAGLFYCALAAIYTHSVIRELNDRLHFSLRPVAQEQKTLLFALVLLICVSFASGYWRDAKERNFILPPAYKQVVAQMMLPALKAQIESQPGLGLEEKASALAEARQGLGKFWTEFENSIRPYARYLPFVLGFLLFWLMETLLGFVSWIPYVILSLLFPLLAALGATHPVTETREMQRLTL